MFAVFVQLLLIFFSAPLEHRVSEELIFIDEWKLVKEKGEIKVFVKRNAAEFGVVRIEAKIHASLQDFVSYINVAESYPEWLYSCKEGKEISRIDNEFTYYTITDLPFPFYDRVLTARSTQQRSPHVFVSNTVSIEQAVKNKDLVPVSYFKSQWVVTQESAELININFQIEMDPGGNIPAWLSNMAIDFGPYNTMSKLKEILEQKSGV